jgi:hypothetical protein
MPFQSRPRPQSKLSRWSVVAAVFGASCNLLFLIVTFYQDDSLQHIRPNDWRMIILVTAITLAPSLVLLAFRHYFAVAFIYASMLFWILVWRIEYPHQYYVGRKYDDPGVTLVFLGLISAAVFSVWATIRSFVFMWRVLKSNRDEPRFLIGLPGRLHGSITTCETCQRDRDRL